MSDPEPPAAADPPGWRGLVDLLAPVRGRLVAAALLQALGAAASIVPFVCVAEIARELLRAAPDRDAVRALVAVAVAAFALRLLAQGVSSHVTHLADNGFQLELRRRVAARLGRLPLGWFGARHAGEVKRAVQDDVAAMHYLVAHSLPDLVAGVTAPALALAYLATIDWRMTLVTIVPLVAFAACYATIVRGYGAQMAEHAAKLGRIDAAVVELVQGIAVVKAFGPAHRAHARFSRETAAFADFHDAWVRPIARRSALGELACSPPTMLLAILGGGTALTAWGGLAPVDVIAFALLGLGLTAPLLTLGYSAQGFRLAAAAGARVGALLRTPELPEPARPRSPTDRTVALDAVDFTYDGSHRVLRQISATCRPGTVTALVGPSGAGKSTLAALIPRFWDVSGGSVRVGGADVRALASRGLFEHVAFVFQDPSLLRASVRDNIRLARPDADQAAVEAAARAAQVHDRVCALARGYDAVIGDDARLSGGEQQRLAIARALLADRPILVLDEATAFADPQSEAAIQDALSRLAAGRTLVVIAHRLQTIAAADQILVLADGAIVERGRHAELLARGGRYARLWTAHRRAGEAPP